MAILWLQAEMLTSFLTEISTAKRAAKKDVARFSTNGLPKIL
jgi:hypothetical protein